MSKAILAALIGALALAAVGHYVAAPLNIWWYHLGSTQATLANWGYPIILGLLGGVSGFQFVHHKPEEPVKL